MKIIQGNIQQTDTEVLERINSFEDFIGQEEVKNILKSAIESAKKRQDSLGHILLSGDSGFGKTTIANIIAKELNKNIKIITAYAMEKPADMISVLNQLENGDILFIDEIHRLKPKIEEILYIAMEDFRVDLVLEDSTMSLPVNKFTLIGATNKLEKLSDAFKNRFVYKFHLKPYSQKEVKIILKKYLEKFNISFDLESLELLSSKTLPVPREIKNLAIKVRDFLIAKQIKKLNKNNCLKLIKELTLENFGLNDLQKRYLQILQEEEIVGLKTISSRLNVDEKVIEKDIEPLLINLEIIQKTTRGRKLIKNILTN